MPLTTATGGDTILVAAEPNRLQKVKKRKKKKSMLYKTMQHHTHSLETKLGPGTTKTKTKTKLKSDRRPEGRDKATYGSAAASKQMRLHGVHSLEAATF